MAFRPSFRARKARHEAPPGQFEPSPRTAPSPYPAALYANLRTPGDSYVQRDSDRHFGRFELPRNPRKIKALREFKSTVFLTYRVSIAKLPTGFSTLWNPIGNGLVSGRGRLECSH